HVGSGRLGVVDLIACEIATLCRVAAAVEMVQRYVDMFEHPPQRTPHAALNTEVPQQAAQFTSQESYFPVFEATMKDLQQLEEDVVKNITAFYTYMKVMRDMLRKLAQMPHPAAGSDDDVWHRTVCDVVYMQFLGLESARKAIFDLVEFEPKQA